MALIKMYQLKHSSIHTRSMKRRSSAHHNNSSIDDETRSSKQSSSHLERESYPLLTSVTRLDILSRIRSSALNITSSASRITRMRFRFVLILGIFCCLFFHFIRFLPLYHEGALEWNHHRPFKSSLDAIVTVGMCSFNSKDMVDALRTQGKWKGPIYVISDDEVGLIPPAKEEESSILLTNGTVGTGSNTTTFTRQSHPLTTIPLLRHHPTFTEINVRGHHPKFRTQTEFDEYVAHGIQKFFGYSMYSKWHKTQFFELIPKEDNINTILFLDADILAQKPLSKDWLKTIEPIIRRMNSQDENEQECHISLYPERWYISLPIIGGKNITESGKYNSGIMLLNRYSSKSLLQRWSHLLVHPPFLGRDQGKLTQAIEEMESRVCYLTHSKRHVQNDADIIDRIWFRLFGKGTFLHIASAKNTRNKYKKNWTIARSCKYDNLVYSP